MEKTPMKKTKRLLVAAFLGTGTLAALASPAAAVEETVGSCIVEVIEEVTPEGFETIVHDGHEEGASEEAEEALHELEDEVEGCVEAPNLILPETKEIIWGALSFLVLLFLMWRFAFPAVRKAMEDRTEKIRSDLEAAETARAEAEELKAQHAAELADSKAEASRLFDEARQEAATMKADLQARAEADIAEMRQRAEADVGAARSRALADMQGEVSEIVVGAAERVVQRNLDPAAQQQLIDEYIASVGSR